MSDGEEKFDVVGDNDDRSILEQGGSEALVDEGGGGVGVDGGERVVEEDVPGSRVDGSGESNSSLLSTTQADSLGSDFCPTGRKRRGQRLRCGEADKG